MMAVLSRIVRISGAALLTLAAAPPLRAAEPAWRLNLGLALNAVSGADRFDRVYDSFHPAIRIGVERQLSVRWFVAAAAERGEASGTDVLRVAGPAPTGSRFRSSSLDLTVGHEFSPAPRWRLQLGGGPTALHAREKNDLLEGEDSKVGAHLLLAVRRDAGPWNWGAFLRAVWIPDGLPDRAGTDLVVAKEDYSALGLGVRLTHAFWGEGTNRPPESDEHRAAHRDWELRLYSGAAVATRTWYLASSPVRVQSGEHDPYGVLGFGFEMPLTGPVGVAIDLAYGEAEIESRLDYFNTGTVFVSRGSNDAWTGSLGLPVRLWEGSGGDLRLVPQVAYLRYEVVTTGGFTLRGTDEVWTAGLGLASRIGRGPWGLHLALRHLGLVRLQNSDGAFEFEPVHLEAGVSWRPGRRR